MDIYRNLKKKIYSRSISFDNSLQDKKSGATMKVQLHDIVLKNSVNCLEDYLNTRRRSKLDGIDDHGNTPLHTAARYSRIESAEMLLKAGADPNITAENGFTPLHEAAENGWDSIVSLLVQNDDCILDVKDVHGNTPLMRAAYYNYTDIVKILVNAGADLNIQNNSGQTALIISLWEGSESTAELLIKNDCNLKVADHCGHTPFYVAVHCELLSDLSIAKLIINSGYDVRHDAWWLRRAPFRSKLFTNDKFFDQIMETIDPYYQPKSNYKHLNKYTTHLKKDN